MKMKKVMAVLMAAMVGVSMLAGTASIVCAEEEEVVEEGAEEEDAEEDEDEETTEITVALMCLSPMDENATDHVEEALNELLKEKVNVEADFMWLDPTTYATQVPMMLQAGEDLDLMMFTAVPGAGYQSFMSQNQLMDITEYVDEYGDNIKEKMGDYLEATSRNGAVYGVGCTTALEGMESIVMRKDVLDELGLTEQAENIKTWSDYEAILKEVTEKTDLNGVVNMDQEGTCISSQPYMNGGDDLSDAYFVDVLGDSYYYVYGDPDTNKVECYFYNEDWQENMRRAKQFYDEGLIYKDAATAQDWGDTLLKNDVGFSYVRLLEEGSIASIEASSGHEVVTATVATRKATTDSFTKFGFAVPVTAKEPEAAVKVMNLLYGDQEVQDTITWGVEGVDYVKNDDGTLTYPEGVTADTVQYHTADFLYGDRLGVTPWEGDGADIRERQQAGNEATEASPFLGFSVDSSEVSSELAACKNVIDQYKPQLSAGTVEDVDATLEQFTSALSAAGMDKILETYQAQLDAWLASK